MIYNPLDKFYKSTTGAIKRGTTVTFRVKGNFDSVLFVCNKDFSNEEMRLPMQNMGDYFELSHTFCESGLFWYKFDLLNGKYVGLNDKFCGEITYNPSNFQLSVYNEDYTVPQWFKGGIIYQIFPDRFNSSGENIGKTERFIHANKNDAPIFLPDEKGVVQNNDFFGGDLKGIEQKLDYLSELGVTIIYLNPIFKSYSNHRYDTGDYMQIDSLLGDENDLKSLINSADKKGIKIILDGVFNHTGDDSLYFNKYGRYDSVGAYQSENSPYIEWFNFKNYPNKYESWWGIKTLPATNKSENSGFIEYITGKDGVIEKYSSLGIGGWRLDVVDELPAHFVEKIRSAAKRKNKDAIIIGEVWEDASNKIAYDVRRKYFIGKELDSVMNYPLKKAILSFVKNGEVETLSYTIKEQIDHYPSFVLNSLMNLLATHDTFRLLTAVSDVDYASMTKSQMANVKLDQNQYNLAKTKAKVASILSYTLCGVPSVYYGDEIGMQGAKDPLNRTYFTWDNIDEDLLSFYKKLGKIRCEYSVFSDGNFEEIYKSKGVYVFKRFNDDAELLIAVNLSTSDIQLSFDGYLTDLLTEKSYNKRINLQPNSFCVLVNIN
ncbi:MAG: glycoside hydrolase family 13 protein [Clostridia bacterium]|nr:glycoside hydrolase family 13 protein [Clostridia bacterium]